jgi:hypothetical protein
LIFVKNGQNNLGKKKIAKWIEAHYEYAGFITIIWQREWISKLSSQITN